MQCVVRVSCVNNMQSFVCRTVVTRCCCSTHHIPYLCPCVWMAHQDKGVAVLVESPRVDYPRGLLFSCGVLELLRARLTSRGAGGPSDPEPFTPRSSAEPRPLPGAGSVGARCPAGSVATPLNASDFFFFPVWLRIGRFFL